MKWNRFYWISKDKRQKQRPYRRATHWHMKTKQHHLCLHPKTADCPLSLPAQHFVRLCIKQQTCISCLYRELLVPALFHRISPYTNYLSLQCSLLSPTTFFGLSFLFFPLLLGVWICLWREVWSNMFFHLFVILLFFYSFLIFINIWISNLYI